MGFGAASWLALSGATVLAEEAKELGLVDRVVEPEALADEAIARATELAVSPPTHCASPATAVGERHGADRPPSIVARSRR